MLDLKHYETYTRWVYELGFLSFVPFVIQAAATGPGWFLATAVSGSLVFMAAAAYQCDLVLRDRAVPVPLQWFVVVMAFALIGLFVRGGDPDTVGRRPGELSGPEAVMLLGAVLTALALCMAFALQWSFRRLMGLALLTTAVIAVGCTWQGLRPTKTAQLGAIILLWAVIMVPIGRVTRKILDLVRRLHRTRGIYVRHAVTQEQTRFHMELNRRYGKELRSILALCRKSRSAVDDASRRAELMDEVGRRAHACDSAVRAMVGGYRHRPPTAPVTVPDPPGTGPQLTGDPLGASGSTAVQPAWDPLPTAGDWPDTDTVVAEQRSSILATIRGVRARRNRVVAARATSGGRPRFETYVLALLASSLVIPLAANIGHVLFGASQRPLLVVLSLVWYPLAGVVLVRGLRGPAPSEALNWSVAVLGLALTVVTIGRDYPAPIEQVSAISVVPTGVVPATLAVLGLRWTWRRSFVLLAIDVAVVTAALLALGANAETAASGLAGLLTSSLSAMLAPRLSWWILEIGWTLYKEREVSAGLAVDRERLRFARDLHDVYGRFLAAVAMKSRLAAELARRGDPLAAQEIAGVETLAREAVEAVADVVAGGDQPDLATEIAAADTLLRSIGAQVRLSGVAEAMPRLDDATSRALAWVVREAATNIGRHSQASLVSIALSLPEPTGLGKATDPMTLTIRNDGAHEHDGDPDGDPAASARRGGSGLAGLAERLGSVGGTLQTHRAGYDFVLQARVPTLEPTKAEQVEAREPASVVGGRP